MRKNKKNILTERKEQQKEEVITRIASYFSDQKIDK